MSMTKKRDYGKWSSDEHERFLEAMNKYGNSWKDVASYIKTRSMAQIRSHAQKYYRQLASENLNAVKKEFSGRRPIFVVTRYYRNKTSLKNKVEINNAWPMNDAKILESNKPKLEKNEEIITKKEETSIITPIPCYPVYFNQLLWQYNGFYK